METEKKDFQSDHWFRISEHYKKKKIEGMPKISVVIPTLNQAHVLSTTLESIFCQQNVDYELILVDAGSTDTTLALIQEFKDKIDRVYYVTRFNLPLMINKGAALATGQYFSVLFPGYEFLNPYSLCQIARTAHENYNPDLVYSADNHIEEAFKSYSLAFSESLSKLEPAYTIYPFTKSVLKRGYLPTSPLCMWFKVETFKKLGYLNYHYRFSKSIFDFLCRLYKKKDVKVATTFWTICNTDWSDKRILNFFGLLQRVLLITKYFGPIAGFLWFFRDKPIHIISWSLQTIREIFKSN